MRYLSGKMVVGMLSASLGAAVMAADHALDSVDQQVIGAVYTLDAVFEDTFADLGEAHGFGFLEMQAANPGVDPWLPGAGTSIRMPGQHILPDTPRSGIVINLPEYRLYHYPADGGSVSTWPVGIGREGWSSPIGETRVARKEANPSWYPPQSIREEHAAAGDPLPAVVPPGPDNPMGPFKMNLAMSGYVIHGTNKLFGIGMRVSHGCFRMNNQDVTELFPQVPVGTAVTIVNQPYKLGVYANKLYLEVHTPLDEHGFPSSLDKQAAIQELLQARSELVAGYRLDWQSIRDMVYAEDGIPAVIGEPYGSL
ncbi:L,D-transpeptidase ErfK/SrfK [Halopseudomonas litoralis]|uniref:L,D-transpeptidase ErfK/SrfK n=1 Tax=Halopseudomonas litoralis TaxID=797277 RepID=A0A1H1PFY0_9GAMM|nr:L,D-transpeptidase family protein [Halopseudomonas litoralis]SDS09915.1 L,D-transpeptidase ErfK/SrfK [Halopseudomonas litoralis]